MAEIGLFEAIYSARAIRHLKPDPVPDEIITKVLDAAIRAPSGSNDQKWLFVVVTDPEQLKKINAAILGIYGGQDRGIPVEEVKKFEQGLKQPGKKVEIVIYPDAGHAFENPNNKAGYRPDDAADAWKRTLDFLAETLKK